MSVKIETTATQNPTPAPVTLPTDGMSRFKQFEQFCQVLCEIWRTMVRDGKAPQPIRLSLTCVMYRNSDLYAFLADPVNYHAEVSA